MEAIIAIVLAILAFAVIGFIVSLVWIIQVVSGSKRPEPVLNCPRCENATPVGAGICQACQRPLFDSQARTLADLAGTRRKIQQWQSQGKLDPDQAKAQLLQIESERRVLMGSLHWQ